MSACLYSCLSYPAHKAHLVYAALYYHVWYVRLYHILTLSHERHDLRGKKLLNIKCTFLIFSTTFLGHISHSKKNWERCSYECTSTLTYTTVTVVKFYRTSTFSTDFRQILKYQVSRKSLPPAFYADGWTDRHDATNSRFSQFCVEA